MSDHNMLFRDAAKPVRLDDFRNVLIRQEETIIFALIERSQFVHNPEVYSNRSESGSIAFGGLMGKFGTFNGSFLDFMLSETEKLHALIRRYTSPDENAFFPDLLPEPMLTSLSYPTVLHPNRININNQIMNVYLQKILPGITKPTTDHTSFGSTATADIAVLQALSKRIHYGKYIAEAKFQENPELYTKLIRANDAEGIMQALTNLSVEEKVCERVKLKASTYGQDIATTTGQSTLVTTGNEWKVDPQLISDLYRDYVMPLTKEVQVAYLLQRISHPMVSIANGEVGSLAYLAGLKQFQVPDASKYFHCAESIGKVFDDVSSNKTAYGIVPMVDSAIGMVKDTQTRLLQSPCLKISAEIKTPKAFVIAAGSGVDSINSTISTAYIPAHVDEAIVTEVEFRWPTATIVRVANVVEASKRLTSESTNSKGCIAVTTASAANLYQVNILETNLSANASATIRYVLLSRTFPKSTGKDKSCFQMHVAHEVGALLKALEVWKNNNVNLVCLESIYRVEGQDGGYDFYVEIIGHVEDANVKKAIDELESGICGVTHLGSFPWNA